MASYGDRALSERTTEASQKSSQASLYKRGPDSGQKLGGGAEGAASAAGGAAAAAATRAAAAAAAAARAPAPAAASSTSTKVSKTHPQDLRGGGAQS